jgi:hypothetical protein
MHVVGGRILDCVIQTSVCQQSCILISPQSNMLMAPSLQSSLQSITPTLLADIYATRCDGEF